MGCPIRIFTDYKVCAPPRNFSQLITSFIASESLGIRHAPLLNLLYFLLQYYYCNELFYIFIKNCLKYLYFKLSIFLILTISFYQYVNELYLLSQIVENIGVEPMTSCVQGKRSSQLS